jgi:hypothetical protein
VADLATAQWRFVLCDLNGVPISILSSIATERRLQFPLDRPAVLNFTVPSESPHVNILHTDGDPYLSCGNRTIKAYRKEYDETTWTLRFAGIVWNLQDNADGNTCKTQVTAYDPMQLLTKRVVRAADGTFATDVTFVGQQGQVLAKALVDRTIAYAGACAISTALGTFTTAPTQSAIYTQQYVATALIDLCNTGSLDVWFDPLDRTDGILAAMSAGPIRGATLANVIMSYAAPGHTAFAFDRSVSMDNFANSIFLYGGSTSGHLANVSDSTSQTTFHTYEDVSVLTDVSDSTLIDALANEQLAFRKDPRDLITMLPTPEKAPLPWRDYFLGDVIQVYASIGKDQTYPTTRQAISGAQRVYGITIDVDDDGVERVSGVDLSPQGV